MPRRQETVPVLENLGGKRAELEEWAAGVVVPWGVVRRGDYDFRGWVGGGELSLLRAGCVYEGAREARRLRCLLVLVERALEEGVNGVEFMGLSFEGVRYYDALMALGGWFGWLRGYTWELAENVSFGELDAERLKESLGVLARYFVCPKAVSLDFWGDAKVVEPRVLWPAQLPGEERGGGGVGNERVKLELRLKDFSAGEIAAAMKELAGSLCGQEGPQLKGTGKGVSIRSRLDCLSAMRLASRYPKTRPLPPLLPRRDSKNRPHRTDTAVSKFNDIRLGGILPGSTKRKILGEVGHNEFDRYAARGRQQFLPMFPFGESAANSLSWAQRHA